MAQVTITIELIFEDNDPEPSIGYLGGWELVHASSEFYELSSSAQDNIIECLTPESNDNDNDNE